MLYVCNENYGYNLTQGKVYDLIATFHPWVSGSKFLKGIDDEGRQFTACARCFSPAPRPYLCVDNLHGGLNLTVGKVYQGVPVEHGEVLVTNDKGHKCPYLPKWFTELKDDIAIGHRQSYTPPTTVTHDQIAAVLNPIVSKLTPGKIARERLVRIALALAPAAGRDSFLRACGFAAEGDSFLRACADAAGRDSWKPVYPTQ